MAEVYTNPKESNDTNEANLKRVFADSAIEESVADTIDEMIKADPSQPLTVIQMDMDKSIEIRKCGISAKIAVLEEISSLLCGLESDTCKVIPHGTRDDITIIRKSNGNIQEETAFIESVLKLLETTPFCTSHESGPFHVTYSGGIAVYPVHGKKASQLLELADGAVRYSKDHGRNTYAIADTGYRFPQYGSVDYVRMTKLFALSCRVGLSVDELIREGYEALFQKHAALYRFCSQEKED